MGLTNSRPTPIEDTKYKKLSDEEIKNNIMRMYKNGTIDNGLETVPESINELRNMQLSPDSDNFFPKINLQPPARELPTPMQNMQNMTNMPQMGGVSNKKFKSSNKRYLNHNIQNYLNNVQNGGDVNDTYKEISDMSEFERIKNYLVNDMNNQAGGAKNKYAYDDNADNDMDDINDTIDTIKEPTNRTLSRTLFDIKQESKDESDDLDDFDTDSDTNELNDQDNNIDEISETSDMPENIQPNKYSETSYLKSDSSELHILPFYSSDSAGNQHPYAKNRF